MEAVVIALIAVCGVGIAFLAWRLVRDLRRGVASPRRAPDKGHWATARDGLAAEVRRLGTGWRITVTGEGIPRDLVLERLADSLGTHRGDEVILRPGWGATGESVALVREDTVARRALLAAVGFWTLREGVLEGWVHGDRRAVDVRVDEGLALGAALREAARA